MYFLRLGSVILRVARRLRIGWPHHYTALLGVGAYALAGNDTTLTYTPAADTTPDAFTFSDLTSVGLSTVVTSSPITISGLSSGTTITLNASGGTIDKNADANFLGSQLVQNGDTVRARVTSSSSNSTAVDCTVVASPSGVQDTFTATTLASSGGSDPYAFRSPTGSDKFVDFSAGSDGSGSDASPWNTLTLARLQSLSAGQALWFKNGSGSASWSPIAATSGLASGNASNRITLACYPGHNKTRWNFTGLGKAYAINYWDIREQDFRTNQTGFRLGWNSWDGGDSLFGDLNADNVRFIDCVGTKSGETQTDNSGLITFATGSGGAATNISVIRCAFTGELTQGNNQSLIWTDHLQSCVILGCDLNGSANPIYFKHVAEGTNPASDATHFALVKNCIIRNAGRGIQTASNFTQWINCAFHAANLACDEEGGGSLAGNDWTISHCSFLDSRWFQSSDTTTPRARLVARNNVMLGNSRYFDAPFSSSATTNSVDYSACDSGQHYNRNHSNFTRAQYNSTYPPNEANAVVGTIAIVGGTSPGNTPANWALTGASVGIGNASDGGNRGVNAANLLTVN